MKNKEEDKLKADKADERAKSGKQDSKLNKININKIKEETNPKWKPKEGKGGSNKGDKFKRKKTNDPSWYVANQAIVKDVASLPFAVFNGLDYECFKPVELANKLPTDDVASTHTPGVAVYKYMPWYGTATPTSALNLTMRALYSFVRHANSGRSNYEAPDLMLYIMAMDSIYLIIHETKRLLRLAYLYVLENRDIPEKVYDVLGIDLTDVIANLANYRAQLNTRIAKANSLAVPANFNIFKRRAVMGSVVLTDEPNRPTQLIVPKADGYYMFNATTQNGGSLGYVTPGSTTSNKSVYSANVQYLAVKKSSLKDYLTLLDSMLAVILSDEDMNIMSGDIIKAYGSDLYSIPFLQDNEIQEIIHDENLLLQFTNSTVLDIENASFRESSATTNYNGIEFEVGFNIPNSSAPVIAQQNGTLVAKCVHNTSLSLTGKPVSQAGQKPFVLLDTQFIETSDSNSITPENVLEWTRLTMAAYKYNGTAVYTIEAGVELGLGWLVAMPLNYWKLNDQQKRHNVKTIVSQWFQFGYTWMQQVKTQIPDFSNLSDDEYTYYIYGTTQNRSTNFSSAISEITRYNYNYVGKMIDGLSFGPRQYCAGKVTLSGGNIYVYADGAIAKMYEKTALASRWNITAMHDAALLGLISSPYVTNSK